MNKSTIDKTLVRVERCVKEGYEMEALLGMYHLNMALLLQFASLLSIKKTAELKPKHLLANLEHAVKSNDKAKMLISGKNLKIIKTWMKKMDFYFKALRFRKPATTKGMIHESEKIFLLLHISYNKLSHIKTNSFAE